MFRAKTAADFERELQAVKKEKELFDKRSEIDAVKKTMRRWKPPTTTKIIVALIFINCTVVEIYSMAVMWFLQNLDALYALISAVIGESISFAVYAAKAYNETKQEEIIRLERDKMEAGIEEDPDDKAAG